MINFPVYLDYNATTPVDPEVLKEMEPYFTLKFGNPSSRHTFGYEAETAVKLARERLSVLIKAAPEELYFTSCATESINMVHMGIAKSLISRGRHIISSEIEHPASLDSLKFLEQNGFKVTCLPVNSEGIINIDKLPDQITRETILVSIMTANNEIGTLADIEAIGNICKEKNVLFHTDASQALGKIEIDLQKLNIDMVSFSGHKFYAPKGVGGLFIRKKSPVIKLNPLAFGGGQEKGLRPGTLNVPGIVGIGKAAELCTLNLKGESSRIKNLRDKLLNTLKESLQEIELNGSYDCRLPNNLNICFRGVKADALMMELRDLAFSAGSACASESEKLSPVLKALGLKDSEILSSVRFGLGRFTTDEEIDFASRRIIGVVNKIRNHPQNKIN